VSEIFSKTSRDHLESFVFFHVGIIFVVQNQVSNVIRAAVDDDINKFVLCEKF
jgi:hypothetical protein